MIDGALASIDCTINKVYEIGDHLFVLGDVVSLAGNDGNPLLFFKGGLGTFAAS